MQRFEQRRNWENGFDINQLWIRIECIFNDARERGSMHAESLESLLPSFFNNKKPATTENREIQKLI